MVQGYTKSGINGDDRLPALSGLAKTMMATSGLKDEQYVARLWTSHSAWDLIWKKSHDWLRWLGHCRVLSRSRVTAGFLSLTG